MKRISILMIGLVVWCSAFSQNSDERSKSDSIDQVRRTFLEQYRMRQRIYQRMYEADPMATVDSVNQANFGENQSVGEKKLQAYLANTEIDTLKEIDLSYAGLDEVPEFVFDASSLEVLILDFNHIKKLPKQLGRLENLKRIYWRANKLDDFFWIRIQEIPGLEKLDISNNLLTRLPLGIKKLEGLKELVAEENFFGEVPVSRLKRADFIKTVSFNKAHRLELGAADYDKIDFIEVFKANKCGLKTLDSSFYQLKNLKELQLQENEILRVPEGISALKSLTKLSFYKNKLTQLPEDLFDLKLVVIDLYYNELEVIPEAIGDMSSLSILFLSNNKIYSLPESIGKLTSLEELYVHHNRLSVLPESISNLKKLRVGRVNDNYLVDFPTQFLGLELLEDLDISANQIKHIPDEVSALEHLRLFTYQDNPIDFNRQENKPLSQMIVNMIDKGVICVPRIYKEETAEPNP